MRQHFLVVNDGAGIAITEAMARAMDLVPCGGSEASVYWVPRGHPDGDPFYYHSDLPARSPGDCASEFDLPY
jgi:hypothetical protein